MNYFVTGREKEYQHLKFTGYKLATLNDFTTWISNHTIFQLDTETLFVDDNADVVEDRKLVLIQLGDIYKKDQWVIEHTIFQDEQWLVTFKTLFENTNFTFICHNAFFEYTVIKANLGIRVENVHDTFLMSKILNTGLDLEKGYHSLDGCVNRFFGINLDKSEQTSFTFDVLTESQIKYAADDVLYLYDLFLKLKGLLEDWDLWFLYNRVEREVIKAYADMGLNFMKFDTKHWRSMISTLKIDDTQFEKELNEIIFKDPKLVNYLKTSNLILGNYLIQPKNQILINWGSNIARKEILTKVIPDLISLKSFTKPELKKIYKSDVLTELENKILKLYLDRDFTTLNRYLRFRFKDWLLQKGYFLKENTILINWSSNVHKLYVFQFYYPRLENTNAKTLNKIYTNELISKYKKYSKVHKRITTYGENFITKYVTRHDTIAPRGCRSILNTGRIAYGILLQLPAEARFRNAFLPPKDNWVFVDSDYSSAEVAIMAHAAGETVFLDAIRNGEDAHMKSAALIFHDIWKESAEDNCIQLKTGARCECKEHERLRKISKAITFGLAYGLSFIGLADRLDITRQEAKDLMELYFKTFPKLQEFFENSANEGMNNNRIVSLPPTKRIRFFHPPIHDGERQAIGRASKNLKIQETNASMLKIALIKLRKYIIKHDFPAKLHLPVHDESLSSCHKDVKQHWKKMQELAMTEAADMFIEPGLLNVDTKFLDRWTK